MVRITAKMGPTSSQLLLSYTKRLQSYIAQGRNEQALSLFHYMRSSCSLLLDPFVFPLALKSCTALNRPSTGASVHCHVTKAGLLSNPFVSSALVDMYGKCVSLSSARKLFDEILQRNVVVWNVMISLYCRSKDVASALKLFGEMDVSPIASSYNAIIAALSESDDGSSRALEFYRRMWVLGVRPNLITVLALLPACVGVAALSLVREIHGFSIRNYIYPHPHLSSGLVEVYGRCGCLMNARRVFDEMAERDVVTWSSMVSACALHGEAQEALLVFKEMELAGIRPDGVAFLGVLKACSHAGLADEALKYFTRMRYDYGLEASRDHYSCLVDVLSRAGRLKEAHEIIRGMPMEASAKAWGALLGACRNYGEVGLAEIAGRVLFEIEPDNAGNFVLLASIYAGAGKFEEAEKVRREMKERGVRRMPGSSWVISQES
ncbi:putative pentatricopeptide repeat-containing protein At1g03510 [Magnolia sinica]|uniref:putative pentatricopeptide repeat-containing protein At1g03510 n=1 Tax=Magnolia sinica TaxID=86752 RepID=UPI00265B703E|nr:putative pentatricopeptide repeat-containing protein At1g03510 [Magnolia sinica]